MQNLQLTKSSTESDLKRYFTAVLELSKSDNKFPINLDEVWPLVYAERGVAVRTLKKNFFENEDYISIDQNVKREIGGSIKTDYFLSLSCLEYFIARKVRPVFEVYRQVFHKAAITPALPTNYKEALTQLLAQVEQNEQLQLENKKLHDNVQAQQNINNMLAAEVDTLTPKGRVYDQVISNAQDNNLYTTRQVAQEIGMTDRQLFSILLQLNVIYKQSDTYMINADYVKWGLHKMTSYIISEANNRVRTYLKWTVRGRAYIHALHDVQWDKRRAWHLLRYGNDLQTINA